MHSFEDDNELDQVTKRAAEAFDAPGMSNWEKMQLLLDKEMPLDKPKRRFVWVLIPALLLLGIGGAWWYHHTNQQMDAIETKTKSIPQPTSIDQQTIIEPKKSSPSEDTRINNSTQHQSTALAKIKSIPSTPSLLSQMGIDPGPIDPKLSRDIQTSATITNTNQAHLLSKNQSVETDSIVANTNSIESNPTATNTSNTKTNLAEEKTSSIVIKNKSNSEKGFFIGLTAGIDASTVHFNYKEDFGYNIGGIIGYRFNQHFSIKTGGIYTQKNYKMNGVDFHPPKGSWVSNFKMETVTGSCDMWDIPLIGSYHFKYNGKGNYFASLGTSSYFMKKENYSYLYYVNNQTYNRSASYSSTDQHLFALLHISGGIEKPIGKHLTGIIEPYAKIPMSGVGFGSIELSSFGVNFSLTYKQPKRK
jgi:Outer membrane protein beta-barrel domain